MQHRVALFLTLLAMMLVLGPCAAALEINAAVGLSTVSMVAINQQIQLYADDHHESIAGIHSALSLSLGTTFRLSVLGLHPCIYGHSLFASSGTGGGPIQTTALGLAAGGRYAIGPWSVHADLGVYRGTFSFPRAAHDVLSGWGVGINGAIEYEFHLTERISAAISFTLRWLTIGKMFDESSIAHMGREAPFFDCSGVGAGISLEWIAW